MMSNKTYDFLKSLAQYVIPALATFIIALGEIWGIPYYIEISATLMAIDTFLGAVLGYASAVYKKEG